MNTEVINHLKEQYRLHLFTEEGKKQLQTAIKRKKEWVLTQRYCNVTIGTYGVKKQYLPKKLVNKIKKIQITPIGLNNMCHLTSELFCDDEKGITKRLGFNITACPCGRLMSYEIHSVNKYKNELYDFTKDFNDEKEKYFLEMDTEIDALTYIELFSRDPIAINKGCVCNVTWNNANYNKEQDEVINHIEYVEGLRIVERDGYRMITKK